LSKYLTDHRAGAVAGCRLAERLRKKHRGTPMGSYFAELADAVEADRRSLDAVIASVGSQRSRSKNLAGWMTERLSRLKFNDRITGSAPLTMLLELETLALGVEGKFALWKSLQAVANTHPALASLKLDELVDRARSQRRGLEAQRLAAAKAAFAAEAPGARATIAPVKAAGVHKSARMKERPLGLIPGAE
jgi:hypothetical protein